MIICIYIYICTYMYIYIYTEYNHRIFWNTMKILWNIHNRHEHKIVLSMENHAYVYNCICMIMYDYVLFAYTPHFPLKRACRAVIPVASVAVTEGRKSHDALQGSYLLKDPRPDLWQGCTCHYHLPAGACRGSRLCVQLINSNHFPGYIVRE